MITHQPIILIRDHYLPGWTLHEKTKMEHYQRETRKYIYAGIMRNETWVKKDNEDEIIEIQPVIRRVQEIRQFWK